MKKFAIISQKGGAGKTTLTLNLAVQATLQGKSSVVVDLDPQASSTGWFDSREAQEPLVISAQASRLKTILNAAEEGGADVAFIDTAPHSESASLEAARAADLIIIPCRPTILDLRAIGNTIDLAKLAGTKAVVVLNSVPPRGSLTKEAQEAIEHYGVELAPASIGHRSSFIHSLTAGMTTQEFDPRGKGSDEIDLLYKWIWKQTKKQTCAHVVMSA